MAGKQGDIALVRALRRDIVLHAANSAAAKQAWTDRPEIDAWIIYNIWLSGTRPASFGFALQPVSRRAPGP